MRHRTKRFLPKATRRRLTTPPRGEAPPAVRVAETREVREKSHHQFPPAGTAEVPLARPGGEGIVTRSKL